ncbi:MAG: F0F1 ATP synthase subunit gamma [Candidatus Omnitrophica bacterium]|nr:F0F1 ATP synthase subunit gamma [Candidatus Omnitrophota bacterium]
MIPVAEAKKELGYNENLKGVIDVLKFIASSEFSRVSEKVPKKDTLKRRVVECCGLLKPTAKEDPFFCGNEAGKKAFLLVCSDEGFLGGVNTRIFNMALAKGMRGNVNAIVLGEKGAKLLRDSGMHPTVFPTVENTVDTRHIRAISNHVMRLFRSGSVGSFYVSYVHYKSFTSHQMETVRLLPADELITYVRDNEIVETIVAPEEKCVTEYLAKLWLESNLHKIFWSSKLSEWATKVMHLENSSDELKEITEKMRFQYFKSVHALNDKVIREIFATRAITM